MKISECTKFPVLGINRETETIVKFIGINGSKGTGELIKSNNKTSRYCIGYFSDSWAISNFKVYHKKLKYNRN